MSENEEIINQIQLDAVFEEKDIKRKNSENTKQIMDMTLKVNADLMLKEGKKKDEKRIVEKQKLFSKDKMN